MTSLGDAPGTPPVQPRGRRRAWLMPAVLVGSLALNLFLGGILLGAAVGDRGGPPPPGLGFVGLGALQQVVGTMPPDSRSALADAFAERRGDIRSAVADLLRARREARDAAIADPLDPVRLAESFRVLRQRTAGVQQVVQDALVEAMPALSVEDRRLLAERLSRSPGAGRAMGEGGPGHRFGPQGE